MNRMTLAVAALALFCAGASAQAPAGQQQAPPTWDQMAERTWSGVHDKIIAMLKDFPEDKFSFKIHPDTRSFIEEVQHCTGAVLGATEVIKGGRPNMREINAALPKDRAALLATLEKARTDYLAAWTANKLPNIIRSAEHAGEHYGKLVQIYRANGLMPPASRTN